MANVVKKHSTSSELAQKMVDEAVAKAREIGVRENAIPTPTMELGMRITRILFLQQIGF